MDSNLDRAGVSGDWMHTFTGTRFTPLDPRPEDIHLADIAHALAHQCRYGGHCREFYSVAQHSVLVSTVLPSHLKLAGLLHDAAEAYLQDLIRPLKCSPFGELYIAHEDRLMRAIAAKFGVRYPFPFAVKNADNIVLFTEKRDLVVTDEPWADEEHYQPFLLRDVIVPWAPQNAEAAFLTAYKSLTPRPVTE